MFECPVAKVEIPGRCVADLCIHHAARSQSGCGYKDNFNIAAVAKNRRMRVRELKQFAVKRMERIYNANVMYNYLEFCGDVPATPKGTKLCRRLRSSTFGHIPGIREILTRRRVSAMLSKENWRTFKRSQDVDGKFLDIVRSLLEKEREDGC